MSKKARARLKAAEQKRQSRSLQKSIVVIALILSLGVTCLILARWRGLRGSFNPIVPVPTPTPAPQLSKEYIYAGGKLVATEEPSSGGGGTSPLSVPAPLTTTGGEYLPAQIT